MAIQVEGLGHLTIYKKGWLENGKIDPDKYMFTRDEIKKIIDIAEKDDDVVLATPKIDISGIVSNSRVSTIFAAQGLIPSDDKKIRGSFTATGKSINGERMSNQKSYGVEMAVGLAKILDLKPGSNAVLMGPTLDGQMNALDLEVAGVYDTGNTPTNEMFMRVPFSFAQSLYDTDMADRIVVLLDDWEKTETVRDRLQGVLSGIGPGCVIKTWKELSMIFSSVKGTFDMIFGFLFLIVLTVVIMSVINTMGMAVTERTREIGTLRALGLKRRGVGLLFATEGLMIGMLGSIAGFIIYMIVWSLVIHFEPTWTPPVRTDPIPLYIMFVPQLITILIFSLSLLSLLAALMPARRAAGQNVVEALGHV